MSSKQDQEFSENRFSAVPEPTLRRLPVYHQYLKRLQLGDGATISCTQIAEGLNLVPVQVRKDLAYTGIVGKPKTGYLAGDLLSAIEGFLGWDNAHDAFLFGAGNLGSALLGYQGFKDHGLNIIAAVDEDKRKTGTVIHGKKVMGVKEGVALIKRMHIRLGILAVPADAAQITADIMTEAGIKAIWNFAPVKIKVPEDVLVQHENLASSLAVLSRKLTVASPLK